jgi:hypothetical protein
MVFYIRTSCDIHFYVRHLVDLGRYCIARPDTTRGVFTRLTYVTPDDLLFVIIACTKRIED